MARRHAAVAAAAAALAALPAAQASIYPRQIDMAQHGVTALSKPTPMFALDDSPSWLGGLSEPYVSYKGTVHSVQGETFEKDQRVLRVLHLWAQNPPSTESILLKDAMTSCSELLSLGEEVDGQTEYFVLGSGSSQQDFSITMPVNVTAWHMTFVTNCLGTTLDIDGTFAFRNPFGYLNGWAFGIMPLNGLLCLTYGVLAVIYIFKTVRNREHVLRLQYAIIAVIIMGFVERLTWFLTYLEMNSSGGRACCPVRSDLTFSLSLAVFKRSSSALLLLAVCLGFGVVKPKLDRSTNIKIVALGVFYTFASLNLEIEKITDISESGRQTDPLYMSSLIVSICDVIILFWIYFAISEILQELREGKQLAKYAMYQTLARSLSIWVAVWFLFTFMEVLVFQEQVDIAWRYWFILVSFWDIFFLGILLQICYIWLPSPRTAQYAFSQQLPTNEELDEFDQVGLEMNNPETASEFVIGDDEDDEDDDELSLDGIEAGVPANGAKKDKVALD